MDVLDDDEERPVLCEPAEGVLDSVEQLSPLDAIATGFGEPTEHAAVRQETGQARAVGRQLLAHRRLVDREPAEHLGERQVGQCGVTEIEACAT